MSADELNQLQAISKDLGSKVEGAVRTVDTAYDDMTITVNRNKALDALAALKEMEFNMLLDIAGVDGLGLGREERFEVVYILYSIPNDLRLRIKVFVPETDLTLPTVTGLWQSANWGEREVFDMFGVVFTGHPNLERILCHHEFEGHPLRKDYPIMKGQWSSSTRNMMEDLERE